MQDLPVLDPVFHQVVRTHLASLLNAGPRSFTELKNRLGVTDGNLDAHLRKLSATGYLHSRMVLKDRPQTVYSFSPSGKRAFAAYLAGLKTIIRNATNENSPRPGRVPRRLNAT
jgi:DNA-binding MarR family transcriptional regulator